MVKININGKQIQAEEGKTVLKVARENGIDIPALCYHEEVSPYGACRLCMVEITTRRGRKRLVTSCLYPVEGGLTVETDTERVRNVRRMMIELLLARCPDSEVIQDWARKLGVSGERLKAEEGNRKCILCTLCVRICEEVIGVSAICLANRGVERRMTTPFNDFSEACIGCGSCAYACPTGAITVEDVGDTRTVSMPHVTMEFKLKKCAECGKYLAPERQIAFAQKQLDLAPEIFDKCPDCRRKTLPLPIVSALSTSRM